MKLAKAQIAENELWLREPKAGEDLRHARWNGRKKIRRASRRRRILKS